MMTSGIFTKNDKHTQPENEHFALLNQAIHATNISKSLINSESKLDCYNCKQLLNDSYLTFILTLKVNIMFCKKFHV